MSDNARYVAPSEVKHHVDAALDYVNQIASSGHTLYASSRNQYAAILNEVAELQTALMKLVGADTQVDYSANSGTSSAAALLDDHEELPNNKSIMRVYFDNINQLQKTCGSWSPELCNAGVTFVTWFNYRFRVKQGQPALFYYQPSNIPKWIDMFILEYGKLYSMGQIDKFYTLLEEWSHTLTDSSIIQFPIFKEASDTLKESFCVSPESVVLEHYIKESLYDNEIFFNVDKKSVLELYQSTWGSGTYDEIKNLSSLV